MLLPLNTVLLEAGYILKTESEIVNIAYQTVQQCSAVRAYHDIGKMKILDFLLRLMFSIDMLSKTKLYIYIIMHQPTMEQPHVCFVHTL